MRVSSNMTYLSSTVRTFTAGDLAGRTFRRVHFLDTSGEPVSIYVNNEQLFERFRGECVLGDLLTLSLDVRSGNNGMYTEIVDYIPCVNP